jgi:hypothetical protein
MRSCCFAASPGKKQPNWLEPMARAACRLIRITVVKGMSMFEIQRSSIGRFGSLNVEASETRSRRWRAERSQ